MAEESGKKSYVKTESYLAVISEAKRQAQARINVSGSEDNLITISDVFNAVCIVDPQAFSLLTGKDVSLLKIKPVGDIEVSSNLNFSSEVDRYLSPYGGVIDSIISEGDEVKSLHIAGALLCDPIPEVQNLMSLNGIDISDPYELVEAALAREAMKQTFFDTSQSFEYIKKIQEYLKAHCFGQDEAINTIVTQLSIAWGMPSEKRGGKPLSFFFVGAPGTGKNHVAFMLQEAFEEILGIQKLPVIDFARFADPQMAIDLIGRDKVWQGGGHIGELTKLPLKNGRGIITIDNYESGHPISVSYLNTILETGVTKDDFTGKNVCFSNNIFIIITHKREFAESEEFLAMISKDAKTPPRDKIIEGLAKFEPGFYSTLRLVDLPILFRKHEFQSFWAIVKDKLAEVKENLAKAYSADCAFESEDVYCALVEMHENIASAHPIKSGIESSIFMPIQKWLLQNFEKFEKSHKIRIECDHFPELEGAPKRDDYDTFDDWMEARTKRRLSQAKRLVFTSVVELSMDAVVLRFTNMSYQVMPTIEDAEYFSVKVPDVSFADLVGVGLVKDRITEVIDYFNNPNKVRVKPDTGIILYGPPGTGKTSVAKAIAKELGVPFINVMGADFMRPGHGVESVKKLFSVARRYGAVIFIDEIDAIGSRQFALGESAWIINAFLTELDGFKERDLLVIGATNRYYDLDDALVRPGRLSLKIQLGLLHNSDDRRKLILNALKKAGVNANQDIIDKLVISTNAWSPAELVAMVNRGIRFAKKEGAEIEFKHFAKARTTLFFGEDNQKPEETPDGIWVTAVHEAGHIVASVLSGISIVQASIIGAGNAAGYVDHGGNNRCSTKEELSKEIETLLAGRAAEELLAEASDGVQSDFCCATHLAGRMILIGIAADNFVVVNENLDNDFILRHEKEINTILKERMTTVKKLLDDNKDFLNAVAIALINEKTLFEADILAIKDEIERQKNL